MSLISDITNIKLPPKVPKRGRPKGSEVTVVGLPKKKKRRNNKPVVLLVSIPKSKRKVYVTYNQFMFTVIYRQLC